MGNVEIIFTKILQFSVANGYDKTETDLRLMAEVLAVDLAGENIETLTAAFDKWRRTEKRWPTVADILALCDEVRVPDSGMLQIEEQSTATTTPGMGRLYCKSLRERWPKTKFGEAQGKLRQAYELYRQRGLQWPATDSAMDSLLATLFGATSCTYEPKIAGVSVAV